MPLQLWRDCSLEEGWLEEEMEKDSRDIQQTEQQDSAKQTATRILL